MSDYADLCQLYGVDPAEERGNLVDIIVAADEEHEKNVQDSRCLAAGRLAHVIRLTSTNPGLVVEATFNLRLPEPVSFHDFNHLNGQETRDPGAWFNWQGFTVRSKKHGDYWVQYVFKTSAPSALTYTEIVDYLGWARLPFDDALIHPAELPTRISRCSDDCPG